MIAIKFNAIPTGAKALLNPLYLCLLAGGLATSLCAQTPAAGQAPGTAANGHEAAWGAERYPMAERVQKRHERRMAQFDKRQAELKKQLNLTAAQEPMWETFAQVMRPLAPIKPPLDRAQMREMAQLPAPQRAQKMLELHEAHHDSMLPLIKSHIEGMKVFYAQLSPEQQKTFDQVSLKHQRGMMHPEVLMPPKL